MNLIQELKINNNCSIKILVPNLKDKFNYYYEATEKLHMFDKVTIILKEGNKEVIIFNDILMEGIIRLENRLKSALNNELDLPAFVDIGNLGYYYNTDTKNGQDSLEYSKYWLWSTQGPQTWSYNKDNKIYLEIVPTYSWLFSDAKEGDNYITFDAFMKTYKPIAVEEIDRATVQKWIEQCKEILNTMITV